MKKCRLVAAAVLAVMLFSLLVPALAAEVEPAVAEDAAAPVSTEPDAAQESETAEPDAAEEDDFFPVLDPEELSEMVADFMRQRGLKDTNFSMAYCYTGTGETWSCNGDTFWHGASFYKLPLMMYLSNKVATGQLQQTDQIMGMDISYIEMRALTYSDNNVSEKIITYCSADTGRDFRLVLADYADMTREELPADYLSRLIFSPNYMMNVLKKLYGDPDSYPNVIDCMLNAEPRHYFRFTLEGKYAVAQKYGGGSLDGVRYLHTAGIVYTPVPFFLVVMTRNATNAEYAIAGMAELMADYTLKLDQRISDHYAELERQAEEARRAEEEARLAAEAEERARLEAEEAARRAEEEARLAEEEARRRAEQERQQAEQEAARQEQEAEEHAGEVASFRLIVIILSAALVGLIVLSALRSGKTRTARR